jgi:hypothetical protein
MIFTRPQPLVSKPCDHTADTISRFMNVNPPTVSQDRTRSLLNNSGHYLTTYYFTITYYLTTSNSTNAILSTSFRTRTRPISTNSGHCKENCTGSQWENEVTVSSKTTPSKSKPIRKSWRQNMVRNRNITRQRPSRGEHRRDLTNEYKTDTTGCRHV